jgi:hypothetical protein
VVEVKTADLFLVGISGQVPKLGGNDIILAIQDLLNDVVEKKFLCGCACLGLFDKNKEKSSLLFHTVISKTMIHILTICISEGVI